MESLIDFIFMAFIFGVLGFFAVMFCLMVLVSFLEDILGIDVRDLIKRWMK